MRHAPLPAINWAAITVVVMITSAVVGFGFSLMDRYSLVDSRVTLLEGLPERHRVLRERVTSIENAASSFGREMVHVKEKDELITSIMSSHNDRLIDLSRRTSRIEGVLAARIGGADTEQPLFSGDEWR